MAKNGVVKMLKIDLRRRSPDNNVWGVALIDIDIDVDKTFNLTAALVTPFLL